MIALPILRSTPALLIGTPVSRDIFCFICVIPNALFHEKERPGIPVFDFLAIRISFKSYTITLDALVNYRPIRQNLKIILTGYSYSNTHYFIIIRNISFILSDSWFRIIIRIFRDFRLSPFLNCLFYNFNLGEFQFVH